MAEKFLLDIVTPYGSVVREDVLEVTAPGELGEFGVLRGHAKFLTTLKTGLVTYKRDGGIVRFVVGRGFAEVSGEKTNIMVESAERIEDINPEKARALLLEIEETLKGLKPDSPEYERLMDERELLKTKSDMTEGGKK